MKTERALCRYPRLVYVCQHTPAGDLWTASLQPSAWTPSTTLATAGSLRDAKSAAKEALIWITSQAVQSTTIQIPLKTR